ncbi:MAG TPA: NeuD/PglB/VioB family sugar acetyltransferase [Methylomirabilota bacterium]|nr:NeuD/PglB/VioB family sugar acetyltransferase [Methylomirabilota bacterium]
MSGSLEGPDKRRLIILGTRTFAEEVSDLVDDCHEYTLEAFGENWERERCERPLLGRPVIWVDDLAPFAATHHAVCAIGSPKRSLFVGQAETLGFRFATVTHPAARVSRTACLGAGSIVSVAAVIAAHAVIGGHVIVNRGSLIGHHTRIGDFTTISPGANIAGSVEIGAGCYIGIGAVISDHVKVGAGCVVTAGAVVVADVPDWTQVGGIPARALRTGLGGP